LCALLCRTRSAEAYQGKMGQVCLEAVASPKIGPQRLQNREFELLLRAAATADQVLMETLVGAVVLGDAVVEVGVRHQAEILEQLQGAIDGRDVDLREARRDASVDGLDRDVSIDFLDCLEDELALRRHALATSPQHLDQRLSMRHATPSEAALTGTVTQR